MNSPQDIDLLVVLMLSGLQAPQLKNKLTEDEYYFTEVDSSGGIIQEETMCLILGINHSRMQHLEEILKDCCQVISRFIPAHLVSTPPEYLAMGMVEARVGGALVYTMNVERFEQF